MNLNDLEGKLLDCVRCAACREVCPTYVVLGKETATPRGRIALMLAEHRSEIPLDAEFQLHMDLCTGCRACEAACPSGVQYGTLIEHARAKVREARPRSVVGGLVEKVALRWLIPSRPRLRLAARILRLQQRPALRRALQAVLPRKLAAVEALAPEFPPVRAGDVRPEPVVGPVKASVHFFAGCVASVALPGVDDATVKVLARSGCQVSVPGAQTCCGALHAHQGDLEFAKELARRNIDAFDGTDLIINNSGGCGAMLKEYGQLLADDPAYAEKAKAFVRRVRDVTEFLDQIGPPKPTRELNLTVAIQDSCHLGNVQKIKQPPRRLLKGLPGVTVREPAEGEVCCGAAGIYNITQPEVSNALLDRKVGHILKTGATVLATANPGCYMHLERGLKEHGVRVAHVVELLEEATRP